MNDAVYIDLHARANAVACNDADCDSELVWGSGDPFQWWELSSILGMAEIEPNVDSPDFIVLWMHHDPPAEYEIFGAQADDSWDALVCEDVSC